MALILNDRVRETTAVTGTGSATLLGAVTGYQSFSTIGNGNTTYYTIADQGGPNWEVGLGTYSSGTLARTTVLSSSNSGSLVNFTAGTKDVFVTQPSEKAVYLDGSGNITPSSVGPLTVSSLTDSGLTSGRVTYAGTGGLLQDSANLTFNGTTLTANTLNLTNALTTSYGGTGLTSFTAGDLPYYSTGTALSKLAIGTNGYILQSNGSAPTWVIASSVIGGAGGSNTQVQYNSSGLLAGSANLTFNGTTLTTANDASISGLTVGKGGGNVSTNTAFGVSALSSTASGSGNIGVGCNALLSLGSGSGNTAVGSYDPLSGRQGALFVNSSGNYNCAFGVGALANNVYGQFNNAFGFGSLGDNTSSNNTAYGTYTLTSNSSGQYNVAVGDSALASNTTASNNTAVGYQAGYTNQTGAYNTFLGYLSGYTSNVSGNALNTFVGYASGYQMTTGTSNVIIGGYQGNGSGLDIRTASNYIVLSDGDGNPLAFTANSNTFALQGATISAGTGIAFPATQSASSDANTLDDYEEGTWTPTATGFSTGSGWVGTYTKIGRMVYLTIVNSTSITATKLTSFFTGLPFLPAQASSLSLTSDTNVNALGQNLVDNGGTNGRIFVQTFISSGTPYVSATYITY